MKEIYTTKKHLVIKVPLTAHRSNPWDEEYKSEIPNIVALVESDTEMGFCYRIDMEYKSKDDQWTDYFYKYHGSKDNFLKLCAKLKIAKIEYPKET